MKFSREKGFTPHHFSNNFKSGVGFTLIEVLIYITLVAGILIMATGFAWNIINSRTKAFVVQEVAQNSRFIMEKIVQSTHQATDITVPTVGNSDSRLELVMKNNKQDPTIFFLDGNTLKMRQGKGPELDLSSSSVRVSTIKFDNLSTPNDKTKNIKVTLTIEHINPDNRQEWQFSDSFETTIELRDR